MQKLNKKSIIFLCIALLIFLYGQYSYEKYDWVVVSKPIDLGTQGTYQAIFKSQKDVKYEIRLEAERKLDFKELDCRLGLKAYNSDSDCANMENNLLVEWLVESDGEPVSSGSSDESSYGYYGRNVGRTLAQINTQKDKEYRISLYVRGPDPVLNVTNPLLQVGISFSDHKGAFVLRSLCNYASVLLVIIVVLIWLAVYLFKKKSIA